MTATAAPQASKHWPASIQRSIVATVALPLIVIAGIYGMNFSRTPLIHDALGFWVAVGSMVAVSLAIVWWLKHRQWL